MDPKFVATPGAAEIAETLLMWPELRGLRVRPLLITTFGDIFVEKVAGEVWIASPIELSCERVATSGEEFQRLFSNPEWVQQQLLTEVVLLARDKGVRRPPDQVFAIAPHPSFTGSIKATEFVPMNLAVWHHLALQVREQASKSGSGDQA